MAITIEISLVITAESDEMSIVAAGVLEVIATKGYRVEKFQCAPFVVVGTGGHRSAAFWTTPLKKKQAAACKALTDFGASLGILSARALADDIGINKGQFSQIISAKARLGPSIFGKILCWLNEQDPRPVEVVEKFQSLWQQSKGGVV